MDHIEIVEKLTFDFGDSDGSDLTDNFEEFHMNSFLRRNADPNKKYLTKTEADRRTVESFTDEFKEAVQDVRRTMDIPDSLLDEEKDIAIALETKNPITINKKKQDVDVIDLKELSVSRKSSSSSGNSNTWQLLVANSSDRFEISHIGSNILQRKKHWLERPSISWETVDGSRIKCEKWLDKYAQPINS